jgi:hypothetical protein
LLELEEIQSSSSPSQPIEIIDLNAASSMAMKMTNESFPGIFSREFPPGISPENFSWEISPEKLN